MSFNENSKQNTKDSIENKKEMKKSLSQEIEQLSLNNSLNSISDPNSTILLIQDFPKSYESKDIQNLISKDFTEPLDFRIKWINDTSVHVIFKDSQLAQSILDANPNHPIAKFSIYNNNNRSQRPLTTDIVARRLVAGALGVRISNSSELDAKESLKIQKAKELKQIAKKEMEKRELELNDAWDE